VEIVKIQMSGLHFYRASRSIFWGLPAILIVGLSAPTEAAIRNATSPALTDVTAAVAAAVDGDTVMIPAGTATWTSGLPINKAITLQGAGIGQTIIKDGCSGGFLEFDLVANKASRMTGIEFQDGGRAAQAYNGIIYLVGGSYSASADTRSMRIDHCKFDHLNGAFINPQDIIGVIDHCTFLSSPGMPLRIYNENWNGLPLTAGSWSDINYFGSSKFLFIEDNTFTASPAYAAIDSWGGARFVVRHNTFTSCDVELHGTESSGRWRGARAVEVYNNQFIQPPPAGTVVNLRSGVGLIHDNITTGITSPLITLHAHRMFFPLGPFGGEADGTNPWDVNLAGGPFYRGTATGGGTNPGFYNQPTVTVSGNPWTTDQWKGYSIKKLTGAAAQQYASEIETNTSNTITYLDAQGYGTTMTFSSGDTFAIYKVVHVLDSPGRSGGSLIQNDPPTLPGGWNNQITDPCYEWNNTRSEDGSSFHFAPGEVVIRENEHFINSTKPTGYTPYTYPHPLVTGGGTTVGVAAPQNLRIVP
jgi:hypothetical protein